MSVSAPALRIRDLAPADRDWADRLIAGHQGSRITAHLGEVIDPLELPGLVAERDGAPVGLATVHETPERGLEVVTLHAQPGGTGAGTQLLQTAVQVAAASGHRRVWLLTTNDNLPAIHFFLRRGMHVAAGHRDAVMLEIGAEDVDARLPHVGFPDIADLDRLPAESFAHEVAPLFEGGPRFLARLSAERPFETDAALLAAAARVVRALPADEAIELVNSHPRIGAAPQTVSALSRVEQRYDVDDPRADREAARVDEELAFLNEAYERLHGFRYLVFVAGRPREAIIPLIEVGLRNATDAELRRALDDCVDIAADRLARLRG